MDGKPVTIRTFDLGADKHKEGLDGLVRVAPNPALGLRNLSMHPAQLLNIKQRVLTSDISAVTPYVARMRRSTDPAKLAHQLEKLNE